MEIQLVILLAITCLLLGMVGGLLLSLALRDSGRKRKLAKANKQDLVEVVRFWSDKEGKRVIPEVEDRFISSMDELNHVQIARLSRLMDLLRVDNAPPPRDIEQATPATDDLPVSQKRKIEKQAEQLLEYIPPPPPIQPVNVDLMDSVAKSLQPELPSQFGSKSIVAQVDLILQERLLGTELGKKGIRLVETKDKGMLVVVGMERYDGIDEVPDEEVRAAIHSSVEEWEKKAIPTNQ